MKQKQYFATCPKGLESLLQEELNQLGASATKQTVAGVTFEGDLELAYKACLWSRFANRILLPLDTFYVEDADALYLGASKIPWHQHMGVETTFLINFTGSSEAIKHTQFAAQKIKDAIVDQFRKKFNSRPSVDKENPKLRINAILRKNRVTISLDLSGESLHRRGYRLQGAAAPLKENLAAGILSRAKWPEIARAGGGLVDPMCGSGTLLIEGVMMAADIAPGLNRKQFGFMGWKQFKESHWLKLLNEARDRAKIGKKSLLADFHGYDIDPIFITQAIANAKRAGLGSFIQFKANDIRHLTRRDIKKTHGLCICNPPYGERLQEAATLLPLYQKLSQKLKENFLNWEAAVLTGNSELAKKMGLRAYKKYAFFNGKIPCDLLLFHIKPEWFVVNHQSKRLP